MSDFTNRLRQALVSDLTAPTVWLTATFALVGMVAAAVVAVGVGLGDVALPAGFVATLAGVAGGLVPASLTRQVAVPAGVAIALALPLALVGEGRPLVAGAVSAVVFSLGALAQQDAPTGLLVGGIGSTAYVLAVGMALVRDVSLSHAFWAAVIGLATAAGTTLAARAAGQLQRRRDRAAGTPAIGPLPGRFAARLVTGIGAALRGWRHNPYTRLALRRVVVLTPLVAAPEAWRDAVALYALVVAFSIIQPTATDTLNMALARTAGTIGAILVTITVAVVAPGWVLVGFAVLSVAAGFQAGTTTHATNRLLSTVVGALVGLLATVLIPVPGRPGHRKALT